jgi:signal transduction histidine kinase
LNSAHPHDRDKVYRTWKKSIAAGTLYFIEHRVLLPDGTIRWVESRGHTYSKPREGARQLIGVCMDITARKRLEEELRSFGGRLIEAQEQERMRIARELHDDICQRLALLEIELEKIKYGPELQSPALQYGMDHLTQLTKEIGSDVQSISHELHSSKLEILGTAAAMKSFCAEFSRQHNLDVEFSSSNVPLPLSREVSIGLYRVLQEALHNAIKHSRARHFAAQLRGENGSVELMVMDFGIGFDPGAAARGRGLGLISMRERINLLNGTLSIESRPMQGTIIRAIVPTADKGASQCA